MPLGDSKPSSEAQHRYELSVSTSHAEQYSPSATPISSVRSRLAGWTANMSVGSVNSFCGAVAGAAAGVVTCPLDVIKTKLQAQGGFRPYSGVSMPARYRGMLGTARIIWEQDGLRGMYRGLGPMLFGYLPTWAVYMNVYGSSRDYYYGKVENKWLAQVYASITAGACSTIVTNPIWVIKTRLMSQVGDTAQKDARTPWHYKSTIDAFRTMYRSEGLRAFYSGLAPALLGLTHVAIQFPLYEYFKLHFTGLEMGQSSSHDDGSSHWRGITAATFLSKVCATTATYPHEVIRTRLQTQQRRPPVPQGRGAAPSYPRSVEVGQPPQLRYRGIVMTCQTILREEGWHAFYYGMGTNLIRAVPAAMTTMLTFEYMKQKVQKLQEEGRGNVGVL